MKHLFILLLVLGMLIPVYGQNPLIPEYYIQQTPQGTYKVYSKDQLVVPKFYVEEKPDCYEIYEPGKPLIPKYRIKKKGGAVR